MVKFNRFCLIEVKYVCEAQAIHKTKFNVCCNFCNIPKCKNRCLNSWEKCGLLDVVPITYNHGVKRGRPRKDVNNEIE